MLLSTMSVFQVFQRSWIVIHVHVLFNWNNQTYNILTVHTRTTHVQLTQYTYSTISLFPLSFSFSLSAYTTYILILTVHTRITHVQLTQYTYSTISLFPPFSFSLSLSAYTTYNHSSRHSLLHVIGCCIHHSTMVHGGLIWHHRNV